MDDFRLIFRMCGACQKCTDDNFWASTGQMKYNLNIKINNGSNKSQSIKWETESIEKVQKKLNILKVNEE